MSILPKSRPQVSAEKVREILYGGHNTGRKMPDGSAEILIVPKEEKFAILNVRGYYRDTMGKIGVNDPGMYDDAAFLALPDGKVINFNANTDPSVIGWNPSLGKPYAMLDVGLWYFIRGKHKGQYDALRQPDEEQAETYGIPNHGHFTVIRDNGKGSRYPDTGYHAINYHRGGNNGTSSWGCQTIPPSQYSEWLKKVYAETKAIGMNKIPVMLIEGPIN